MLLLCWCSGWRTWYQTANVSRTRMTLTNIARWQEEAYKVSTYMKSYWQLLSKPGSRRCGPPQGRAHQIIACFLIKRNNTRGLENKEVYKLPKEQRVYTYSNSKQGPQKESVYSINYMNEEQEKVKERKLIKVNKSQTNNNTRRWKTEPHL